MASGLVAERHQHSSHCTMNIGFSRTDCIYTHSFEKCVRIFASIMRLLVVHLPTTSIELGLPDQAGKHLLTDKEMVFSS